MPDPEWDSVGGIVPDLILYGDDDAKPIRIIEVVVTSPPSEKKQQKLDTLNKRGVDVVVLTVKEEVDLLNLCPTWWRPKFGSLTSKDEFDINLQINQVRRREMRSYDDTVWELIKAIQSCRPSTRRALLKILSELKSLDSLYPIRPNNPLKDKLATSTAETNQRKT